MGAFGGSVPQILLYPGKICFKHIIKTKIFSPSIYLPPPKKIVTWLRTWSQHRNKNRTGRAEPPTRLATTSSAPKETLSVSAKAAGVDAPAPFDCHRPENAKGKLDHKQIRRELRKLRRKQRKSGIPRKAQITKPQRPTPTEQVSSVCSPWTQKHCVIIYFDASSAMVSVLFIDHGRRTKSSFSQ